MPRPPSPLDQPRCDECGAYGAQASAPAYGYVDGRPVIFTGEWDDVDEAGYYYHFVGESVEHWIRHGNQRLARVPLFCMESIAANPLAFL